MTGRVAVVATVMIKAGRERDFLALVELFHAEVKANEPDALLFELTRERGEPNTFKFINMFTNQDALDAHRRSNHFAKYVPKMADTAVGEPQIFDLDLVVW